MKMTGPTPMLRTWDLAASISFYESILGFTCEHRNDEWGWASLRRDGAALMLATPNAHDEAKSAAFTGSLYFHTNDVDAIWQAWKDQVRVCYAPENFAYGMREFAIFDNNGYLLQFGQELATLTSPQ